MHLQLKNEILTLISPIKIWC